MPDGSHRSSGHEARRERRNRKVARALVLNHEGDAIGVTPREIARILSAEFGEKVAVGTVRNYLWDPRGEKARAIKDSYRGTCRACGEPTSGGDGPNDAREYCQRHKHLRPESPLRKHSAESIKAMLRHWYQVHGFWPNSHDLNRHWAKRRGGDALRRFEQLQLSASTVVHHFGTVKAGVDAAKRDESAGLPFDVGG
jgi:hypothetical protein